MVVQLTNKSNQIISFFFYLTQSAYSALISIQTCDSWLILVFVIVIHIVQHLCLAKFAKCFFVNFFIFLFFSLNFNSQRSGLKSIFFPTTENFNMSQIQYTFLLYFIYLFDLLIASWDRISLVCFMKFHTSVSFSYLCSCPSLSGFWLIYRQISTLDLHIYNIITGFHFSFRQSLSSILNILLFGLQTANVLIFFNCTLSAHSNWNYNN